MNRFTLLLARLVLLAGFGFISLFATTPAQAVSIGSETCDGLYGIDEQNYGSYSVADDSISIAVDVDTNVAATQDGEKLNLLKYTNTINNDVLDTATITNGIATFTITKSKHPDIFTLKASSVNKDVNLALELEDGSGDCKQLGTFKIGLQPQCSITITQRGVTGGSLTCIDSEDDVTINYTFDNASKLGALDFFRKLNRDTKQLTNSNGSASETINLDAKDYSLGVSAKCSGRVCALDDICSTNFTVYGSKCATQEPIQNSISSGDFKLCNQIPESEADARAACLSCIGGEDSKETVWTAVGCISKKPEDIIAQIITIGIGLGGGVTLVMIIAGGFMLTVSQGNPQKTNEAKEMITSAIIGLLFILFSVVILQFIGVTIFHIPGFGEPAQP